MMSRFTHQTIPAQSAAAAIATLGECLAEDRLAIHGKRFKLGALALGATVIVCCYGPRANIGFIDVEPRYRRQGNARRALLRILDACDAHAGNVDIYLTVEPTPVAGEDVSAIPNAEALERFYASLGFVAFGTDEDDHLIMRRAARAGCEQAVA
jgi:GNAT superfamily N-acetyltransferase